jgi:hypothetical protein
LECTSLDRVTTPPEKTWVPTGSDHIAHWARLRGLVYTARPDETWFRQWEPHDTMVSPEHFYNSVSMRLPPLRGRPPIGDAVIVEPWAAPETVDPLERALLGYATHPGLVHRAAMRTGEPFLTKVAFLESPPPPKVTLDDKIWDEHVTTFAASQSEGLGAFTKTLRELLRSRGFKGHLELRPGGLIVHYEGLLPRPDHYDMMMRVLGDLVAAAIQR